MSQNAHISAFLLNLPTKCVLGIGDHIKALTNRGLCGLVKTAQCVRRGRGQCKEGIDDTCDAYLRWCARRFRSAPLVARASLTVSRIRFLGIGIAGWRIDSLTAFPAQ